MSGPRPVAVVQSGDSHENRTRVLPLARALREAGWDPLALVDDDGAASLFLRHEVAAVALKTISAPASYRPGFQPAIEDLCALEIAKAEGRGEAFDPRVATSALRRSRAIWRTLDGLDPRALFVWNGFTGVWANALRTYKAARGLPGGFMERGPVARGLFVDVEGVNGDAGFARGVALDGAPPPSPGAARDKIVFVPLQVADDSNVLLHAPGAGGMAGLLAFGVELTNALGADWRMVVRPHPEERDDVAYAAPPDGAWTIDGETPLQDMASRAAVCLTLNGTVGLEAALGGAVVVRLGQGLYGRQGFVIDGSGRAAESVARDVEARLGEDRSAEAAAFLRLLLERHVFGRGEDMASAVARLAEMGFDAGAVSAQGARAPFWARPRVLRRTGAYRAMLTRLAAIRDSGAAVGVDFDFEPGDTLFRTYRLNREPITRAHLETVAAAGLGAPVRLAPTHRSLQRARAETLITHSKRRPSGAGRYAVVLDEFGLPHARTYLGWTPWF